MANISAGDYVLYREPGSQLPPWPAVVYTADLAPKTVTDAAPHGFYTLILLAKAKPEFRYVLKNDLQDYDPCYKDDENERANSLKQAHDIVLTAMDSGMGLEYWRAMWEEQHIDNSSSDDESASSSDEDGFDDAQMRRAIELSLADTGKGKQPALSSSAPLTGLPQRRARVHQSMTTTSHDIRKHFLPTPPSSKRLPSKSAPQQSSHYGESSFTGPGALPNRRNPHRRRLSDTAFGLSANENQAIRFKEEDALSTAVPGRGLGTVKRMSIRADDCVEGDISESKEFVEFVVGPDKMAFLIPKKEVDCRPYWRSRHHGRLLAKGKNTWTMNIPCLEQISPDDFHFVAEYLSSGEFGYKSVQDANEREEAMAQLVTAWEVGEKLGMVEFLDHIAEKMEMVQPWNKGEVLAFAIVVYRTLGAPTLAHELMKDILVENIADNYYGFLKEIGEDFMDRIQQLPELEEHVHRKVSEKAKERLESDTGFD